MSVEKIGKVTFSRCDRLGKGRFGCVFKGKYGKSLIDVAIKKIVKGETLMDSSQYIKVDGHPNLIKCFCLKKTDNEFK
jgi:hypothetical protein